MPNERAGFRQPTQESDVPIIGAFGGLSSATTSATGNVTQQQKLVNAYVNKRNEIVARQGSSSFLSVQNISTSDASLVSSFYFSFDSQKYGAYRNGFDLVIFTFDNNGFVSDTKVKTGIFSQPNEQTTFSVVVEDDTCFLLCASRSSNLVIICLLRRNVSITSQPTPTTPTFQINNYPSGNITTANKAFLFDTSNNNVALVSLTQTAFSFATVTSTAFNTGSGGKPRIHLCYACRGISAAYYPGLYFYNTAVRKNLVPLDVNVKIPDELASNPIINEPAVQDLTGVSIFCFKRNNLSGTVYTRVTSRHPSTADEYDFSDGSFTVSASIFTVRTSAYIAFGGLQTPTDSTIVYFFRMRSTAVVLPSYFVTKSTLYVYLDRALFNNLCYDANFNLITNDSVSVKYISLHATAFPGISLSAVVEVMFKTEVSSAAANIVDITPNNTTVFIDDYYSIPLYGLSAVANVGGSIFPTIVQTVGNRVVLTGVSNRILVSSSDWSYRGMSWNNFQVSSINFTATSAYLLSLTQATSVIKSLVSVNGVLIVGTDSGVYRVSGENATTPPNATTANVSRISNEVVASQSSTIVYNNKVYFVSRNGLYMVEYANDNQELNSQPLSAEVSDYFTSFTANSITYSSMYRAFVMGFAETSDLLLYFLESDTFALFKVNLNGSLNIVQSLDGYQATIPTTTGINHIIFCKWDATATDISNAASTLPSLSLLTTRSQTFTEVTQNNSLTTPAELLDTINPLLVQSYGKDTVRSITGNIDVSDGLANNSPLPIVSAFVTKGFAASKLIASNRVRAFNLLVTGDGTAKTKVVYPVLDFNDHTPDIHTFTIDSTGSYSGESFLNNQYTKEQLPVGDSVSKRVRVFGISEQWELAVVWSGGLRFIGYQVDSSSKRRNRLR